MLSNIPLLPDLLYIVHYFNCPLIHALVEEYIIKETTVMNGRETPFTKILWLFINDSTIDEKHWVQWGIVAREREQKDELAFNSYDCHSLGYVSIFIVARYKMKTLYDHSYAFLIKNGIPFTTEGKNAMVPRLEGERYKVRAMGRVNVDTAAKRASFGGNSYAYGIGVKQEHMDPIRELKRDWTIEIRLDK